MDFRSLFKITLTKKIGALLLLPILGSVLSVECFRHYIESTKTKTRFMNIAGRQRMVAAELHDWSHMVAIGQAEDRPGLQARIAEFDEALLVLQHGGRFLKQDIARPPLEILPDLALVVKYWSQLKPDLSLVANLPRTDARFQRAYRRISQSTDELKDLSHRVVAAFENVNSAQDQAIIRSLMATSLFFCLLFVFGIWTTRRYIIGPVLRLGEAAQRIGAGDFSSRLDVTTQDELSVLALTFNKMADQVGQLLAVLDLRRKHAEVIIESIPAGLLILREDLTAIRANSAFCSLFDVKDVKGKSLAEFIPSNIMQRAVQEIAEGGETKIGLRIEQASATDAVRMFRVTIAGTLLDEEGRILLIVEDLSKEVQREQQLVTASKMVALGEMAGGVAHEINNPLGIIKLVAEQLQDFLSDDPLNKPELCRMAKTIENTVERAAKIVRGLRAFSRDGSQDSFDSVTIKTLIDETLGFCEQRFKNNGVDLCVGEIPSGAIIQGRSTELSQVLLNLLNNANDAVDGLPEKWVKLTVMDREHLVEISITDSGNGIGPEVRQKLFQPFFTTKGVGKGTGLGLSISKGILESHNGTLEIDETTPNTCFKITLPKTQERK